MSTFILKNLPDRSCLEALEGRYPEMNADSAEAYLFLMRFGSLMGDKVQNYFKTYGLSPGRMTILMMLNGSQGEHSPAEISDWCGVSRATITGLLDGLLKDGFIERKGNETDRRMIQVSLTPKGQKILNELLPGYFKFIDQVFGNLTANEKKTLIRLIEKLHNHLPN